MVLVFGFAIDNPTLEKIAGALSKKGIKFDTIAVKRSKESVEAYCSSVRDGAVLVLNRSLEAGNAYSIAELDKLVTANENLRIIFVLENKYKGTDYMQDLYNIGVYDACFCEKAGSFKFADIVPLLVNPRTKSEAKSYYSIDITRPEHVQQKLEEQVGTIVDLAQMVKYISTDSEESIDERIRYVQNKTSRPEFLVVMNNLDSKVKGELIRKGGYEEYYANEIAELLAKQEQSVAQKPVTKQTVQYVNVNEAIGVVGLTRECGSTLVALNIARELADVEGLKPCLIQLPHTGSDLFERLRFSEYFGAEFVSHFNGIIQNGAYNVGTNEFSKVNFIVENPLVGDVSTWDSACTLKLLLSAPSPKVIDFGTYYNNEHYRELIPNLKQLVVVVDDTNEDNDLEDVRQMKDLAVAYPNLKVSFVVNKCNDEHNSEVISWINDEVDFLSLPVFDNKDFEIAGCDMLYPNVKGNLMNLAELVGYTINNAETDNSKSVKKKTESVRKLNNITTIEIGIGGVTRGVGTTHTAIMLAMMLKKSYKVAIVEQNDTHAFADLYRKINPDFSGQASLVAYSYKGVDFYPLCNYNAFVAKERDTYDIVIVDCGIDCIKNDNFLRMNKKIMCASASEWKLHELIRYYGDTRKKLDPACKFTYVIPFMPNGAIGNIRKICKGSKVLAMPTCTDAFAPSNDAIVVLDELVDFGVVDRRKKGLFGRKGK